MLTTPTTTTTTAAAIETSRAVEYAAIDDRLARLLGHLPGRLQQQQQQIRSILHTSQDR